METTGEREKIWKYYFDGRPKTLLASGVRNTEKLLFRSGTHEIWGLDHGSDDFGKLIGDQIGVDQPITDRLPGEEANRYEGGNFYGHPYIVDDNVVRPEYYNLSGIAPQDVVPTRFLRSRWRSGISISRRRDGRRLSTRRARR